MSFTQVPALINFVPLTTALSADVNSNFAALRNQFNALVTGTDTLAPFTISGGPLILASGARITGGIVSGAVTFSSGWSVTGGTINVSSVTVSGSVQMSSGFAMVGGVVSGVATFSSGISITGGVVSGVATFSSGIAITGGVVSATGIAISANLAATNVTTSVVDTGQILSQAINLWSLAVSPNIAYQNAHLQVTAAGYNIILAATVATSATIGFVWVGACAGTMTSVPGTVAGMTNHGVPLVYDTTNNRLQIYNGGWKSVLLA